MKKKLNIQTQFFLSHTTIAVISILAISLFFYIYISGILIDRETASLEMMTENFMTQTDAAVGSLDEVSLNISYSNLIYPKLNDYFSTEMKMDQDFSTLVQLFVSLNGVDFNASQINVYGMEGQKIMVGTYTNTNRVDLKELEWVPLADEAKGKKVISLPYATSTMLSSNKVAMDYISVYRAYFDNYGRQCGYLETIQTCKNLFQEIISYTNSHRNSDGAKIYVFDESGNLVYPYKKEALPSKELQEFYFSTLLQNSKEAAVKLNNPILGERELLTTAHSTYTNWQYVCIQKESVILEPVRTFRNILILVMLLLILLAFGVSYGMSKNLTRPIHLLLQTFHKTSLETLGTEKKFEMQSSFNEFDELNDAFNQMQKDLKTSMDALLETRQQELKSRSLALQSQINPHFYYNSLSSIMVLAENGQTDDVILFSKNLSSMMRYITNGNMQVVTLEAEISYVKKYLYCMKTRYQSSLNYGINVTEAMYGYTIPKLLIQPLVENTIKYGTNCEPPWTIRVDSQLDKDTWAVTVQDSGPGFTEEALATIGKRLTNADAAVGMPELEINGLGMVNVYSRWKLFCKGDCFFRYGNAPDGGAYVTIGRSLQPME